MSESKGEGLAPSIDAVSGLSQDDWALLRALVEEFRPYATKPLGSIRVDTDDIRKIVEGFDALEAQARDLAAKEEARVALCRDINHASKRQVELEDRIAALEDAVRLKDEALRAIHNCGQSAEPDHWKFRIMARDRARTALSNGEPHDR